MRMKSHEIIILKLDKKKTIRNAIKIVSRISLKVQIEYNYI